MKTGKTIEQLEKIIDDLKKEKRESAKAYIAENFKMLLDETTILLQASGLGKILTMAIPYKSNLAKKLHEACGKQTYTGIQILYEGYDVWLNQEGQTWRLRVGVSPEIYKTRLEFIKKHVSNYDASLVDSYIEGIKADIKRSQEIKDACEKALVDLVKASVKRATK